MTTTVALTVLLAAILHAVWNALVKGGADKDASMAAVVIGHVPPALVAIPFVPLPDLDAWPYMLAGIALHLGYQLFLTASYRIGDLTQVYPIARGVAPLLVAGVSVGFLGVALGRMELLSIAIIAAGIMSLALVRRQDGLRNPRAVGLALTTGLFIASYSLVDGLGARQAGTALGYYAWVSLGNAALFAAWTAVMKPGLLSRLPRERSLLAPCIVGGCGSFIAYALVVWAFTQAPIALVTALRETSIVFALLIGVFVLRERLDLAKVVSTIVTLAGAALLRFAKS